MTIRRDKVSEAITKAREYKMMCTAQGFRATPQTDADHAAYMKLWNELTKEEQDLVDKLVDP